MRKFRHLLLFVIALTVTGYIAFGQESEKRRTALSTSSENHGYAKDIASGSIVCGNGYVAGTTMNLNLSITFASPDDEYMDGLTITFPTGIVPNEAGTNNPLTTDNIDASATGNIDLITPVTGQSISWGTIISPFTTWGAVMPGTANAVVNVTIAPGTTGTQTVNFTIFGDEYAGTIHTYSGTFTIDAAAANDLACGPLTMPVSAITNPGTVVLSAIITNVGASSMPAGQVVTFTDGVTVLGTSPTTGAIASGASETVTYNWTATAGVHTLIAAIAADGNNTNNIDTLITCIYPVGYWGEGFEGMSTLVPVGWVVDPSWALGTNPTFAFEGTQYAYTATATGADIRLVSPKLEVTSTDFITFHAMTGATGAPYPELTVQYSADNITWTDLIPTATINNNAVHDFFIVNIPVTGQYFFAFNSNNASSGSLRMDWPVMPPKFVPSTDAGTISIDVNSGFIGSVTPKATVQNFGALVQTFTVTMNITGGYTSTKTVTSLAGGATQQVSFDSWTATAGNFTINTFTTLAGDVDASNDALTKSITMAADSIWIHWDSEVNVDGIGTGGVTNFDAAKRFDIQDLEGMNGKYLVRVRFWPKEATSTYRIKVWTGGSMTPTIDAGTLVVDQAVGAFVNDTWNIVTLTTPVTINSAQELWIGYNIDQTTGYSAGVDGGPAIADKGNLIYFNSVWDNLLSLASVDANWNIGGLVSVTDLVGAEEILGATIISVYPNPTSNVFFIDNAANSKIELINTLGRTVKMVINTSATTSINVSDLAAGSYIVKVITNNNISITKINLVK